MTLFGRRTSFALTLCLFLVWLACAELRGESAPHRGKIFGTAVDAVPDCSQEECTILADCKSQESAERVLGEILGGRPAPNVIVTATSHAVTRKSISDSEGTFTFTGLPQGIYEVSAKSRKQPAGRDRERRVSAKKRVRVVETNGIVRLALHEELVTISGRITDVDGQPIAGAKVVGTPVPVREVGLIDTVSTVSGIDGSYELNGFEPLDLYRVAGYLNGGSLNAPGALYTQVEIRVAAEGLKQAKENMPRVSLLAEAQLVPGRRLWKALSNLAKTMDEADGWQKMKERKLPSSHGSTITDVDIVLNRLAGDTLSDTEGG